VPVVYRIKNSLPVTHPSVAVRSPFSHRPVASHGRLSPGRAPASRPPPRLHGGESRRRRTGGGGVAVPGPRLPAARCGVVPGISARASGRRSVGRHTEGGRCVADCSDSACTALLHAAAPLHVMELTANKSQMMLISRIPYFPILVHRWSL